jgi:uncharacterized coiled-coil protein SlyX
MPNQQWDDFALTERFHDLDRRLATYDDTLRGLSHFPIDVAKAALEIEHLTKEIQSVRDTCEGFHEEWQKSVEGREKNRTAMVVGIITGICVVLASLITMIATLVGGS